MKYSGPYAIQTRYDCHFYGLNSIVEGLVMVDSIEKDQCALITKSYRPCQMETEGNSPDWHKCPLNTEGSRKKLEKFAGSIRVFPREFQPPLLKKWSGLSLKEWMHHIFD